MPGRTIAIGDIHGCDAAFKVVLDRIAPEADDTIITLGDYIDRGPASRKVIERILNLSTQCRLVTLIGNHEVLLLSAMENEQDHEFWLACGGRETLESYQCEIHELPEEHVRFFCDCALGYETDTHIFAHANYLAGLALEEQDEHTLLWKHLSTHMPQPHISGKTAVVGHTPQTSGEILNAGHLVCIDTFCFGGGWLTALDVESREIWQADRDGNLRM